MPGIMAGLLMWAVAAVLMVFFRELEGDIISPETAACIFVALGGFCLGFSVYVRQMKKWGSK